MYVCAQREPVTKGCMQVRANSVQNTRQRVGKRGIIDPNHTTPVTVLHTSHHTTPVIVLHTSQAAYQFSLAIHRHPGQIKDSIAVGFPCCARTNTGQNRATVAATPTTRMAVHARCYHTHVISCTDDSSTCSS